MKDRHSALVVFDLDGTLLRGSTVCEVLAESLGRLPRMKEIEAMRDRQDISAARAEIAAWYANVPLSTLRGYLSRVELAPGAARGISLLQEHGVAVGIASITWSFAVDHLAESLGVEHRLGTVLHPSGAIGHVWSEHKAEWVLSLSSRLGVVRERIAAVGDTAGDHEMLGVANRAFFVGAQAPGLQPDWLHWPAASIEHIARHLIEEWHPKARSASDRRPI